MSADERGLLTKDAGALLLSRIVDALRVQLTEADLLTPVNRSSFVSLIAKIDGTPESELGLFEDVYDRVARISPWFSTDTQPHDAPLAASDDLQRSTAMFFADLTETGAFATYRDLLDAFNPGFPATSVEQRTVLAEVLLAANEKPVVTRVEVERQLRTLEHQQTVAATSLLARSSAAILDVEQHVGTMNGVIRGRILDSLFGPTASVIPTAVLREIIGALSVRPKRQSFLRMCTKELHRTTQRLSTVVPVLLLMVTALVLSSTVGIEETHASFHNAMYRPADDWPNYCPTVPGSRESDPDHPDPGRAGGPTNPRCWFGDGKLLESMKRTDQVAWYVREHLVKYQLWGELSGNKSRADVTMFGMWAVGALLVRTSPRETSHDRARAGLCPRASCEAIGLTTPVYEFGIDRAFSCEALDFAVERPAVANNFSASTARRPYVRIPFSATRDEAVSIADTFAPDYCEEDDAATIVQWAMYQPEARHLVWTMVSLTVPKAGHVIPRIEIVVVRPETVNAVLGIMIAQLIVFAFRLINATVLGHPLTAGLRRRLGTLFTVDNLISSLGGSLIIAAYVYLSRAAAAFQELDLVASRTDMPDGLDMIAWNFSVGMDLFGVWFFVFFALASRYYRDFVGVGLVVRLLGVALADIGALLLAFTTITVGFVATARILFGGRDAIFAHSTTAFVAIISVFWGDADFDNLTEQSPRLGTVFYLVLVAFVNFFALNLIIAVMTSPLGRVVEHANLHQEVFAEMKASGKIPHGLRRWFGLWRRALVVLNVPLWGWPPLRCVRFMRALACEAELLYARDSDVWCTGRAAHNILVSVYGADATTTAEGPLAAAVREQGRIPTSIPSAAGFEIIARALRVGSSSSLTADARLLSVLLAFDRYDTATTELLAQISTGQETNAAKEDRIRNVAADLYKERRQEELLQRRLKGVTSAKKVKQLVSSGQRTELTYDGMRFNLSSRVRVTLQRRLVMPLEGVVVTALTMAFISLVLRHTDRVSWLGENLHDALRDAPYNQHCLDEHCANTTLTHFKSFLDIQHVAEIEEYVDRLFAMRMFGDGEADTPSKFLDEQTRNGSWPVQWDRYVRRTTPIHVRQLRAQEVPCQLATRDGGSCYANRALYQRQRVLSRPSASEPVFRDVFFSESCYGSIDVWGLYDVYPCMGYAVEINTESELRAMPSEFLSESTRFLHISFGAKSTFTNVSHDADNHWKDLSVRYDMFVEFSHGAAGGRSWCWLSPAEAELAQYFWLIYALMAFDALLWAYRLSKRISIARKHKRSLSVVFPPASLLVAAVAVLAVELYPVPPYERRTYKAPFLVGYSVLRLLQVFVEPLTELAAPRAVRILRLLQLSLQSVVMVLPFYAIFFVAYTYTGAIVFGPYTRQYAGLRQSALSVSRSMVAEVEFGALYERRPIAAIIYTLAFFAVVIVVLANILLTLVTAAAERSKNEHAAIQFIEEVASTTDFPLYSGAWFEFWMTARSWAARRKVSKEEGRRAARKRGFTDVSGNRREATRGGKDGRGGGYHASTSGLTTATANVGAMANAPRAAAKTVQSKLSDTVANMTLMGNRGDDGPSAATVVDRGRLSLPTEALLWSGFTAFRLVEASRLVDFDNLPMQLRYSAALAYGRIGIDFARSDGHLNAADDRVEAQLMLKAKCITEEEVKELAGLEESSEDSAGSTPRAKQRATNQRNEVARGTGAQAPRSGDALVTPNDALRRAGPQATPSGGPARNDDAVPLLVLSDAPPDGRLQSASVSETLPVVPPLIPRSGAAQSSVPSEADTLPTPRVRRAAGLSPAFSMRRERNRDPAAPPHRAGPSAQAAAHAAHPARVVRLGEAARGNVSVAEDVERFLAGDAHMRQRPMHLNAQPESELQPQSTEDLATQFFERI